jgi:hypothetical protein
MRTWNRKWFGVTLLLLFLSLGPAQVDMASGVDKSVLGPQSTQAKGRQHVLVAAVRFPDVEPTFTLEQLKKKAGTSLDGYVREQSYGKTWVEADFRGWVNLPDPISAYKLSPHNFDVDKTKIRKLIEDTMTALEDKADFSQYQYILVIPGAQTSPGKGYGMLCYCANPGMLTGVMKEKVAYATLKSKRGKEFKGGVFVSAENAHLGMLAHDFFHGLGGIHEGKRLAP